MHNQPNWLSSGLAVELVHALFEGVQLPAARRKTLLMQAGIAPRVLEQPQNRLPPAQFARLYRLLVQLFQDETPGFFSRPLRPGTLKFIGLSLLDAPNLQVALHRFAHLFSILQDDARYEIKILDDQVELRWIELQAPQASRELVHQLMLRLIHGLASWLIAEPLPVTEVAYAFAPASSVVFAFYPQVMTYHAPLSRLRLARRHLQAPLRQTKRDLQAFLRRAPADWLDVAMDQDRVVHQVRDYLMRINPAAKVPEVAQKLHKSVRSLTRQLAQEGASFQQLKDQLRRDLAIEQLGRRHLPINQLAEQLGFETSASFYRAFLRWEGCSPRTYRQRLQG